MENGYVVCEDGICAGAYEKLPECYETFPCYDYSDKLIIPGFADLHVHAPQYSFRGVGMDLELLYWQWIQHDENALLLRIKNVMSTLTSESVNHRKYMFMSCKERLMKYLVESYACKRKKIPAYCG